MKREIIIFSIAVIALSSLICFISFKLDDTNTSILSVFTPSLVALVMTAMSQGRKGIYELFVKQTIRKAAIRWFVLSLLGIPLLASLAMISSSGFDFSSFHLRTTQLLPQMIVIFLIAVGEEYGWRGFLLPRLLRKFSVLNSSIILGLIWGVWHFPAYLIGTGVPQQMNFVVFLLWVVLGTLFMSWIYYYSRSVLTSILFHISANAAFNYLLILPEFTGSMTTFWFFIGFLLLLMFAVYYVRRNDLVQPSTEQT